MTEISEEQLLLTQLRSGEESAFEALFLNYYDGLVSYANKYLQDHDQAEETVQDLFYKVWHKRVDLEITSSLASYLYRAARNACLNHLKHLKIRQEYQAHVEHDHAHNKLQHDDVLEELELAQKIEAAVNELPDARQQIFRMNRYEGLKYREIAEQLDLSMKTVESQMSKALKFLRSHLKDYMLWILVASIEVLKNIFRGG